jgi:universal stress protein A
MKLKRILCPIDYSPYSKSANYYASVFAEAVDAEIIFLNVADPPTKDHDPEEDLDDAYMELSTKVQPFIHNLRHDFEVRSGNPAKEIVDVANHRNVDLIVMGTHGRTGTSLMIHGSVCEKVLRNASCPVMAVKSTLDFDWVLPEAESPAAGENDPDSKD